MEKAGAQINTDAIVCSSQPAPRFTLLLFRSAIPQFNPPPIPFHLPEGDVNVCWFANSENV